MAGGVQMVNPIILPTRMRGLSSLMGLTLIASCSLGEIWELLGNYPVFIAVMVIYHCIERVWGIVVTLNFLYNIYDHEKYYPGDPVNINIQSLLNII